MTDDRINGDDGMSKRKLEEFSSIYNLDNASSSRNLSDLNGRYLVTLFINADKFNFVVR